MKCHLLFLLIRIMYILKEEYICKKLFCNLRLIHICIIHQIQFKYQHLAHIYYSQLVETIEFVCQCIRQIHISYELSLLLIKMLLVWNECYFFIELYNIKFIAFYIRTHFAHTTKFLHKNE